MVWDVKKIGPIHLTRLGQLLGGSKRKIGLLFGHVREKIGSVFGLVFGLLLGLVLGLVFGLTFEPLEIQLSLHATRKECNGVTNPTSNVVLRDLLGALEDSALNSLARLQATASKESLDLGPALLDGVEKR